MVTIKRIVIFLSLLFILLTRGYSEKDTISQVVDLDCNIKYILHEWKYRFGDNISWASADLDVTSWEDISYTDLQKIHKGIHWLRIQIQIQGWQRRSDRLGILFFNVPMAIEVYWDGEKIGQNGFVGWDKNEEVPGKVNYILKFEQDEVEPGIHLLAVRLSNHHNSNKQLRRHSKVAIGYSDLLLNPSRDKERQNLLFLGLNLVSLLLVVSLLFGGWKYQAFIFLGIFNLLSIFHNIWVYTVHAGLVRLNLFQWGEYIVLNLNPIIWTTLILFLVWHFNSSLKWLHIIFMGVLIIANIFTGIFYEAYFPTFFFCMFIKIYALVFILTQWKKKMVGTLFITIAVIVCLLRDIFVFLQVGFFPILHCYAHIVNVILFSIFFSCLIIAISLKLMDQFKKFQIFSLKAQKPENKKKSQALTYPFIVYRKFNENHVLELKDIQYFKAERVLIGVYLRDGKKELVDYPLNRLEEILPNHFLRIHRSIIVNLNDMISYQHVGGSSYRMKLKSGKVLPISRSRIKKLKALLPLPNQT